MIDSSYPTHILTLVDTTDPPRFQSMGASDNPLLGRVPQVSQDGNLGHPDRWLQSAEAARLKHEVLDQEGKRLGRAARAHLDVELDLAAEWAAEHWQANKAEFGSFTRQAFYRALRQFYSSYRPNALWRERCDEEKRDAAILAGPSGCSPFLEEVDRRLRGLRNRAPNRWYIEGIDSIDLHQEVALSMVEAIKNGANGFKQFERAGHEATLLMIDSIRSRLLRQRQKERRWRTSAVDVDDTGCQTPEALLIDLDRRQQIADWPKRLRPELSRPQRRWLRALLTESARCGESLRWAHAAELIGRDKSSASRVVTLLQNKLNGLDARELIL